MWRPCGRGAQNPEVCGVEFRGPAPFQTSAILDARYGWATADVQDRLSDEDFDAPDGRVRAAR